MPISYGISDSGNSEKLLKWSWLSEQMDKARSYWIGTTRPDSRPHLMPVWGIWMEETFLFSTGRSSRKAVNLNANPAIVVHLESGDDVVIFEGMAAVATDMEVLERYAGAYETKYDFKPDPKDPGNITYILFPRVAFAWLESDFVNSAVRWQFEL